MSTSRPAPHTNPALCTDPEHLHTDACYATDAEWEADPSFGYLMAIDEHNGYRLAEPLEVTGDDPRVVGE